MMVKYITTSIRPSEEQLAQLERISNEYGFEKIQRRKETVAELLKKYAVDSILVVEKERLVIRGEGTFFWHPNTAKLSMNAVSSGFNSHLASALDLKEGDRVLDCTLGMGTDALVIASLVGKTGSVVGLESQEILSLLVSDGMRRYVKDDRIKDAISRVEIFHSDYLEYLKTCPTDSFDVVYFDPMFQIPKEKSLPIDNMRLHANRSELTKEAFMEAKRVSRGRVVIKERFGLGVFERLEITRFYGEQRRGQIVYGYEE